MDDSFDDVLVRAKKGDVAAFEAIITEYEKLVYNIAYRFFLDPEDAKDMAQEALLKVYRNLDQCKDASRIKSWICAVTANTCKDELRKRKNRQAVSIDALPDFDMQSDKPSVEEQVLAKDRSTRIAEAIAQLPEEDKTLIILRDLNGLRYEELAEVFAVKMGTVKSRLSRARLKLRELLREQNER